MRSQNNDLRKKSEEMSDDLKKANTEIKTMESQNVVLENIQKDLKTALEISDKIIGANSLYEVLDIETNSEPEDIRTIYHCKTAIICSKTFKNTMINAKQKLMYANKVLGNENLREKYDDFKTKNYCECYVSKKINDEEERLESEKKRDKVLDQIKRDESFFRLFDIPEHLASNNPIVFKHQLRAKFKKMEECVESIPQRSEKKIVGSFKYGISNLIFRSKYMKFLKECDNDHKKAVEEMNR